MINKLEERKLKRETKYKVYSFLGLLLLSILLTVLVLVSNQTSSKDYPLTYKVLGEKENTVFQDSDLELLDISYPITDVKLYGKDSQLKEVKEVALLIDLRAIDYESLSKPDLDSLEEEVEGVEGGAETKEESGATEDNKETNKESIEGNTEDKGYEDVDVEVTVPIKIYDYRNGELSLKQSHYESTVNLKVRIYKEEIDTETGEEVEEDNKTESKDKE